MLTYFGFLNSSTQQRQDTLATCFGRAESFRAHDFNVWFNQRVIGCEYWFRALPDADKAQVLQLWKKELDNKLPEAASTDAISLACSSSAHTMHIPTRYNKKRY